MVTEDLFDNEDSFRFFQLVHMFQRSVLFNLGMLPLDQHPLGLIPLEHPPPAVPLLVLDRHELTVA